MPLHSARKLQVCPQRRDWMTWSTQGSANTKYSSIGAYGADSIMAVRSANRCMKYIIIRRAYLGTHVRGVGTGTSSDPLPVPSPLPGSLGWEQASVENHPSKLGAGSISVLGDRGKNTHLQKANVCTRCGCINSGTKRVLFAIKGTYIFVFAQVGAWLSMKVVEA